MLLLFIYVLFSFLIEGFMSNIFASTLTDISYFTTIYTIISFLTALIVCIICRIKERCNRRRDDDDDCCFCDSIEIVNNGNNSRRI